MPRCSHRLRSNLDVLFALGYTKVIVGEEGFIDHDLTAAWFEAGGGMRGYF